LRRVIERFEQRGLLVVRPTDELDKVDLPHECLCLKWKRLEKWIEDETQDAKTLRFLADSAGKKSHLTGTALTEALLWQEAGRLKEVWGQRYLSSKEVSDVDNWVKESKRRTDRLNQLLKGGFIAMTVLAIAAVVGGLWAFSLYRRAEALAIEAAKQTKAAKENADEAIKQKGIAEHNAKEAKDKSIEADKEATKAKDLADEATKQKGAADKSAAEAKRQKGIAEGLAADAKQKLFDDNIVVDKATGLMWTRNDNFANINWNNAEEYCRKLTLVGLSGWQLPTIDQLKELYDPKANNANWIRKPFRLSGDWVWSSQRGSSGFALGFFFYYGSPNSFPVGDSNFHRALCVRRSGG